MDDIAKLEQSNLLITSLTFNQPQLFIVISDDTNDLIHSNYSALIATQSDISFLNDLIRIFRNHCDKDSPGCATEFIHDKDDIEQHYSVTSYPIYWKNIKSHALILKDISAERGGKKEKEQANLDKLTKLHNRLSGILQLNKWIDMKKEFILYFVNLDNLKSMSST